MKVKVITDSTADIAPEIMNSLDISVVPVYVRFGDRVYRDGIDITKKEFYQLLRSSPVHPATSQPPPEDFAKYYSESMKEADSIVSIHISSKMSGTYNSAMMAKKILGPTLPIHIVDSKFNSGGLGLVVKAAATMALSGASAPEIISETNRAIEQVHMYGMFETMKYLARSGRVNKTIAAAANFLNIMPLLTVNSGEVARAGFVRTVSKGMERIYNFVRTRLPVREVTIVHSDVPDQVQDFSARLSKLISREMISITELGAALGVHGGPGALIVALRTC